jgi:uncharacterized protein YfeS
MLKKQHKGDSKMNLLGTFIIVMIGLVWNVKYILTLDKVEVTSNVKEEQQKAKQLVQTYEKTLRETTNYIDEFQNTIA